MQTASTNLSKAYLYCQNLTQKFAKSFYFATKFLPNKHKPAIYAIYAFCRYTDNLVDEPQGFESTTQIENRLLDWQKKVDKLFENQAPNFDKNTKSKSDFNLNQILNFKKNWQKNQNSQQILEKKLVLKLDQNMEEEMILLALQQSIWEYKINKELFFDLFRGVKQDLYQKSYQNFDELDEYCYLVAGVVGLMLVSIVGYSQEYHHKVLEFASKMGKALQITNILRDIKEDFLRGRIYLPQEDLDKFGYSKEDLAKSIVNENFKNLLKFYIKKARKEFAEAWEGFDFLVSGGRLALKSACLIYIQILNQIEKADYDVFSSRVRTSYITKINLLLQQILFPNLKHNLNHKF